MIPYIRKKATNLLYPIAKRVVRKKEGLWHHRKMATIMLEGIGVEIGAMHNPQKLSANAKVEYVDIITKQQAIEKYPELLPDSIVEVTYICDIDKEGLVTVPTASKDFVIMCHIIEHTANPIFVVEESFRVLKQGGYWVVACPDKNYTFDKDRPLTTWQHLLSDYQNKINYVEDVHLIENVQYFSANKNPLNYDTEKLFYKKGKAHVHVWDSESFDDFLKNSFSILNIDAKIIYKNMGNQNGFEYFAIIKKK